MTDPNPRPEVEGAPEAARTLIPLAIGPLKDVPGGGKAEVWALYVGAEPVALDAFMGTVSAQDIARHLLRRWMGVRP